MFHNGFTNAHLTISGHGGVALTRDGARLAARLAKVFPEARALAPGRFAAQFAEVEGFQEPVGRLLEGLWAGAGGFLLVMAAGEDVASFYTDRGWDRMDVAVFGKELR